MAYLSRSDGRTPSHLMSGVVRLDESYDMFIEPWVVVVVVVVAAAVCRYKCRCSTSARQCQSQHYRCSVCDRERVWR